MPLNLHMPKCHEVSRGIVHDSIMHTDYMIHGYQMPNARA